MYALLLVSVAVAKTDGKWGNAALCYCNYKP